MGNLLLKDAQVIWEEDDQYETLIDFNDLPSNCSSINMAKMSRESNVDTIPEFLKQCYKKYSDIVKNPVNVSQKDAFMILMALCFKKAIERHRPLNVLEIGCCDGSISYFLAKLLYFFNPDSKLHCLTNTICTGESPWLKRMDEVGAAIECVNLITADFDTSVLRDNHFDIVLLNGNQIFVEPAPVMRQALRTIRVGGLLLCFAPEQYLLRSTFQVFTDNCREYALSDIFSVFSKKVTTEEKELAVSQLEETILERLKLKCASRLEALEADILTLSRKTHSEIGAMLHSVSEIENSIVQAYDAMENVYVKLQINQLKESLMGYFLADSEDDKKYYLKDCVLKYNDVLIV